MVKHSKPESQPSEEQLEEDFSTAHPLNRNRTQTQELIERALKRKDADDFKIKEVAEWKLHVNAVAATDSGKVLLRSMLQYSGIMAPPDVTNANRMVTNTIKAGFYLTWIRPFLQPEVRRELE